MGNDEYVYHMMKDYFPRRISMLRYHSFMHNTENAHEHLMNDHDREMFRWVSLFSPYDLYSKSETEAGKNYDPTVWAGGKNIYRRHKFLLPALLSPAPY